MINRACISINNRCNLNCSYCHFHDTAKAAALTSREMDVYTILDNIKSHIEKYDIPVFKLGFVGNGEPLLDMADLSGYIAHIASYLKSGRIAAYTITNGTIADEEAFRFLKAYNVNVGVSIDGLSPIHDKYRCDTHKQVIRTIELIHKINGRYPSLNCTVGREVIEHTEETIDFFEKFDSRITFSRMIGKYSIGLDEYRSFLEKAKRRLNVRTGGYDCTMYGGLCGAGINNIFYANGKIYLCGNCIDLDTPYSYDTPLDEVIFNINDFDRSHCYKEEHI